MTTEVRVRADAVSVPARRREQMAAYVRAAESVRNEELADRFGVSLMTVHRDLEVLAAEGWLEKTRGGARAGRVPLHESSVKLRWRQQAAQKRALARAALAHLRPGMTLATDDSTTAAAMLPLLRALRPLTLITNFLPAINRASADPDLEVIALGGRYDRILDSFDGPAVIDQLRSLSADSVVVSSFSIHSGALFHPSADTARRKRALIDIGEHKILLVDSTKFSQRSTYRLGPVTLFDLVIVDEDTAPEHVEAIAALGVRTEVVRLLDEDRLGPALEG